MSRNINALSIIATFLSTGAVAQPLQFDLNCAGKAEVYRDGKIANEPFTETLHIDLPKGEYCYDSCSNIFKLHDVNSTKITLVDNHLKRSAISIYRNTRTIDRTNGNYSIVFMDSDNFKSLSVEAICRAAPFTPFPSTKF